jgi:tRNA A22 N-methylase
MKLGRNVVTFIMSVYLDHVKRCNLLCRCLAECQRMQIQLQPLRQHPTIPTGTRRLEQTSRLYSSQPQQQQQQSRELAYEAFSVLARREKSWRRLGHLVDLAIMDHGTNNRNTTTIRSIADVGTDHGLLAMGLALSGRFDKVVGVDVSQQALQDGALSLLEDMRDHAASAADDDDVVVEEYNKPVSLKLPVEFRLSNGLEKLELGEADAICIAGMGVNTMLQILSQSCSSQRQNKDGLLVPQQVLDLDRLGCQQLLLQPTNSRPRNLIKIYDELQSSGWRLVDERIEELSSRWYISSCFVRAADDDGDRELPTAKLAVLEDSHPMKPVWKEYWQHHLNWIQRDIEASGRTNEADERWRERFCS